MGKGSAPEAPDFGPLASASKEAAQFARQTAIEQLDWAKQEFAYNKDVMERVLAVQLPAMESESAEAAKLRERYNTVFQPIEDALVQEAKDYASPDRKESEAGRAIADVSRTFDAQRKGALARLEGFGVDPTQTRGQALDMGVRVQEAAAQAAAGTQSRQNTENTGRALRGEAINIGKGLPSNIAGAYGTAMAAGQTGMQSALQTTASGASTMGTANQWAGTQQQALGQWGNAMNQGYQNQLAAFNANQQSSNAMGAAIGGLLGKGMGMISPFKLAQGGPIVDQNTPFPMELGLDQGQGPIVDSTAEEVPDQAIPLEKADTVPAMLSHGEFVIPASVVRKKGTDFFEKMVAKFGDPEDQQAAQQRQETGAPGGEPVEAIPTRRAA